MACQLMWATATMERGGDGLALKRRVGVSDLP